MCMELYRPQKTGVAYSVGTQDLRSMLDRMRSIRHACDLDLLLFFYRHPLALLTGEQLVAYLGRDREQVASRLTG
jgi:hypothetical protein